MKLRLRVVRIFALDWASTVDFYEHVLELEPRYRDDVSGWAEFDTGEAGLAVERVLPDDAEAEALTRRFLGASLQVEDIHDTHARLSAKGVRFVAPPAQQPWGGWLAHFEDPEGNVLTLLATAEDE